jgi:ElaB/YqjD/DUF883 family membrane-anchored ribosome-binding protein
MLPPSSDRLIDEIRRLLVEFSAGFLLLMPTQPVLDSTIRNQLEQHQSSVLSLNEIVAWGASGFVAAPTWETHRNAYVAKHHADRMVAAPPAYALQRQGDFWIVRFDGQQTILKDTVGMAYITELVAQPHEKVFAPDLLAAVSGHAAVSETSSAGPQTDKQTLDEVKQKYLDAQAELEEAERNNDLAAQERLQRELDGLTDYLKTVKGFNGRTREASDEADKIRRAMTQAIGRVQDSLGAEGKLPAAAQHLRNAIKTGLFMSYEPEEELHWSL